jgi:hypothetical protein
MRAIFLILGKYGAMRLADSDSSDDGGTVEEAVCWCFLQLLPEFLQLLTSRQPLSTFFLHLSLKGMLRTLAGLGKIGIGAVRQRMRVAMRELALHRIVAVLLALVGLERTLSAVRIVFEMIGGVARHGYLP